MLDRFKIKYKQNIVAIIVHQEFHRNLVQKHFGGKSISSHLPVIVEVSTFIAMLQNHPDVLSSLFTGEGCGVKLTVGTVTLVVFFTVTEITPRFDAI